MKRIAVLIDAGFFIKVFRHHNSNKYPTAQQVVDFAKRCVFQDEELFRIYFYNCLPLKSAHTNPIDGTVVDFGTRKQTVAIEKFHNELAQMDYVAFRKGTISFNGWVLNNNVADQLRQNPTRQLQASDFEPDLRQKQVDMKIGLDVAWLASKHIVDRVILISGDYDLAPALKFARREGIQTVLVTLGHSGVRKELFEHTDEHREVPLNSQPNTTTNAAR